jgi:hypothetical protein
MKEILAWLHAGVCREDHIPQACFVADGDCAAVSGLALIAEAAGQTAPAETPPQARPFKTAKVSVLTCAVATWAASGEYLSSALVAYKRPT